MLKQSSGCMTESGRVQRDDNRGGPGWYDSRVARANRIVPFMGVTDRLIGKSRLKAREQVICRNVEVLSM